MPDPGPPATRRSCRRCTQSGEGRVEGPIGFGGFEWGFGWPRRGGFGLVDCFLLFGGFTRRFCGLYPYPTAERPLSPSPSTHDPAVHKGRSGSILVPGVSKPFRVFGSQAILPSCPLPAGRSGMRPCAPPANGRSRAAIQSDSPRLGV